MSGVRMASILIAAISVTSAVATAAHADVYDEAWRQANRAYFEGDYEKAAAAYEEIDRQGVVSEDLYFNMGVAYYRLGELGRATWSFERVLVLDGDDADARYNLEQVRKVLARKTTDRIEGAARESAWIRIVRAMSPSTQTWLFVVLYVLVFAVLLARLRARRESRAPYTAAAALLAVAAAAAGLLLLGRVALDRIPFAVVLPEAVAVKEGADANYRTSFEVHAGLRVRITEDMGGGWVKIRLANGLEGFVRARDVGRI